MALGEGLCLMTLQQNESPKHLASTKGHIFNKLSHMGAVGRKFLCVYNEVFGHFNVSAM